MNLKVKRNFLRAIKDGKGQLWTCHENKPEYSFCLYRKKKEDSRLFYWQSETATQAACSQRSFAVNLHWKKRVALVVQRENGRSGKVGGQG